MAQGLLNRLGVRAHPFLAGSSDVRAQARPAKPFAQRLLNHVALQILDHRQRQLAAPRAHRDAQHVAADDVRLPLGTRPAAVGVDGGLAVVLHQQRHAKRPVLSQERGVLGQRVVGRVPLGAARFGRQVGAQGGKKFKRRHRAGVGKVERVPARGDDPFVELGGRRRPAGALEQNPADAVALCERTRHGQQFRPGARRLQAVLGEFVGVVVGDLHVGPEGHEVPLVVDDARGLKGGIDRIGHAGFLVRQGRDEPRVHQLLQPHVVLGEQVDLHAPRLLHGTQPLNQGFGRHVDGAHLAAAQDFERRQDVLPHDLPLGLRQPHRHGEHLLPVLGSRPGGNHTRAASTTISHRTIRFLPCTKGPGT